MNYFLTEQMGMSNELIIIAGVLGVAILLPICLHLEKRERAANEASAKVNNEAAAEDAV